MLETPNRLVDNGHSLQPKSISAHFVYSEDDSSVLEYKDGIFGGLGVQRLIAPSKRSAYAEPTNKWRNYVNHQRGELPQEALLNKYKRAGAYTDCYFMDVQRLVRHAEYVEAFYTSAVFKVERLLLSLLFSRPSNDLQAKQLARGEITNFAAWSVEGRTSNQLLLCDFLGRTRSWLMSVSTEGRSSTTTRLYFGSAVIPKNKSASGQASYGLAFHALSRFHHIYSRTLLRAALSKQSMASGGPIG